VTKNPASNKSTIKSDLENDRRHSPRFPWVAEIKGSLLSPLRIAEEAPVWLEAVTENIGPGGIGILTDLPLAPKAVLRCEFAVPGSPLLIPTLMQVRWSDKGTGKLRRKVGLKFLI
jgi:hypothetical protein